jgi:NADPH:quinone reductase-like Zn-dependent oxidoreductase
MKTVVYHQYGSPEVLKIKEVEKPSPRDNEVLVKIHAATVTAVDSIFRKGESLFARLATGILKPKIHTLGTELSGVIESTGKDVTLFKPGEPVFGDSSTIQGAHAEYISLPEYEPLAIKPANLSFEEAACVPYGALTALPFLRDNGHIQPDHKVLVIGASGSVGTYAVQFARYFGAEVTGVCSTANIELVRSLGADHVIDYTREDFTRSGLTWNIIFDTVGKSSFSHCKKSLARGGIFLTTYISFSILFQMVWTSKIGNKKAIIAFTGLRLSGERKKDLILIQKLLEDGKLKPVIDQKYPLDKIVEAHRYVDQGHKRGNVIITIVDKNKS